MSIFRRKQQSFASSNPATCRMPDCLARWKKSKDSVWPWVASAKAKMSNRQLDSAVCSQIPAVSGEEARQKKRDNAQVQVHFGSTFGIQFCPLQ